MIENKDGKKCMIEYQSMNEFYTYLCNTPFNEAFRWSSHSSVESSERFSGTKSFDEAVDLMKNGWQDMSQKLTQTLKAKQTQMQTAQRRKMVNDVAGFQPIVPLYLAGAPNNMVSQKMVPVKQKVINITKSVSYACYVDKEEIIEESIKALQIVKKIEAMGYRVNLNIAIGTLEPDREIYAKVRIKSANEKLNISKTAFPLVHPSMLRRLYFRFVEVYPEVTKSFVSGYGRPASTDQMKKAFPEDIIIPAVWEKKVEDIKSLEDMR